MKRILFLLITCTLVISSASGQLAKAGYRHGLKKSTADNKSVVSAAKRDGYVRINPDAEKEVDLRATQAVPQALYTLPDGYYRMGTSKEGIDFSEGVAFVLAPAYYGGTAWKNLSSADATGFEWAFPNPAYVFKDPEDPENTEDPQEQWMIFADKEPEVIYPFSRNAMPAPQLVAFNDNNEATSYVWGLSMETAEAYIFYGGKVQTENGNFGLMEFGATNLETFNGKATTESSEGQYVFGSNVLNLSSCAELFSKPVHPYVLDQVTVGMSIFSAPRAHEFKLTIHRMENGVPVEVIATSTATRDDVYTTPLDAAINTMVFKGFNVKTQGGFELTMPEIVIADEILVEFSGYYGAKGVTLNVADQKEKSDDGKSTAYLFVDVRNNNILVERQLKNAQTIAFHKETGDPLKTSLDISLGITYTFLVTDENTTFEVPAEGISKTFEVNSFYSPTFEEENGEVNEILEFENMPDWVTTEVTFDENTWKTYITFNVDAMPANQEERSVKVTATIPGSSLDFNIVQLKDIHGITENKAAEIKVTHNTNGFEIAYPSCYSSVKVYNVSGQCISNYQLPKIGSFNIPANSLMKGVYMLRFSGDKMQTIKIIR